MAIAFISGHRDLTKKEFDAHYKQNILRAMKLNVDFIVCDYKGADIMSLLFLVDNHYPKNKITVYHMFDNPRNSVNGVKLKGGFKGDVERDSAATRDSDFDILWVRNGKEGSGTHQNQIRRKNKINGN